MRFQHTMSRERGDGYNTPLFVNKTHTHDSVKRGCLRPLLEAYWDSKEQCQAGKAPKQNVDNDIGHHS